MISWRSLADRLIELPVVTSYSSIGPALRRRLDQWRPLDDYRLQGRVIAITGATSGIGLAAAQQLARCGATLVLVARDEAKAAAVAATLRGVAGNGGAEVVVADMGDLPAVRRAAAAILALQPRLDVLIHNAGALNAELRLAADGTDTTYASQVTGPFLLTALLRHRLELSAPARVLTVSSGGMYTQPLDVSALDALDEPYHGSVAYARAKRVQVTLNEMWSQRMHGSGIVFQAMHPGWVDTPGLRASLPGFRRLIAPVLRSPQLGADTLVWLAADGRLPLRLPGRFWLDRRPRPIHLLSRSRKSDTAEERDRLWRWCEQHSGAAVD